MRFTTSAIQNPETTVLVGQMLIQSEKHGPRKSTSMVWLTPWPKGDSRKTLPRMTDDESRKFGQRAIEFGRYACQPVESVPLDYLLWLDEQPDFRRDLNKYLRSDRIQQEQG
jgi:hypothetical protein